MTKFNYYYRKDDTCTFPFHYTLITKGGVTMFLKFQCYFYTVFKYNEWLSVSADVSLEINGLYLFLPKCLKWWHSDKILDE